MTDAAVILSLPHNSKPTAFTLHATSQQIQLHRITTVTYDYANQVLAPSMVSGTSMYSIPFQNATAPV